MEIHRKERRDLKPAAARAEEILAGGLLNLAPLANAGAAEISAALASKGIRMQQVLSQQNRGLALYLISSWKYTGILCRL